MVGSVVTAIFVLPLIGRELMNRRRAREGAEWQSLGERLGLAHRGAFPECRLDGTLDGIAVSIRHETQYGAKGAKSYFLSGWAEPAVPLGPITIRRASFFARLARRNAPRGVASGELSVAEAESAAGRLSTATGSGALTAAAAVVSGAPPAAPSTKSGFSASEEIDLAADFARTFDGVPSGVSIPHYVMSALLADVRLTITNGRIEFESREQTSAPRAEKILIELAKVARAFG